MPSFDVVSTVNLHEVSNAVDQANREITQRFDFKGTNARFTLQDKNQIIMTAPSAFQVQQMTDILQNKLSKRGVDIRALDYQTVETNNQETRQMVIVRQGIEKELAKKIVKYIKGLGTKAQSSVQGEQVRVTSKKRDELQSIIQALKEASFELPLQYENFRD